MRKFGFIIVLICYFSAVRGQIIIGTVYDQSTDSTLSDAAIYLNGTSIATYSDKNGNFELKIPGYSSLPISISMPGYNSITIDEHSSRNIYRIYLTPKIEELKEVVVSTNKGKWDTYLRMFKKVFLGETKNALECNIINENDLRFSFSYDSNTLRAFSLKPILICNSALAYTISYYLDNFSYSHKNVVMGYSNESFQLRGNYLFTDDLATLGDTEKIRAEERRKNAYLGSRMHFFRSLFLDSLIRTGRDEFSLPYKDSGSIGSHEFLIFSFTPVHSNSILIRRDSISGYFRKADKLVVSYGWRESILNIKTDSAYFDKNGYFDANEMIFDGDMALKRIGDLLPYEYKSE
jgi:hypothetical protein